jgi:hypothetical protein
VLAQSDFMDGCELANGLAGELVRGGAWKVF